MSPDVSYLRKRPDGQRDSDENSPSEIMRQSSRMNALDAVLRRDEASGAFVLTAGTRPTNPVDLLSSQQMHKLIYTLRESADMVIIDSAPIAAVSDARILASMVDKTVFVVRWATTRREVVAMALRQLLDARAEFAGVVLSRVDVKKHSRYGYGDSGYYYGRSAKYYTE